MNIDIENPNNQRILNALGLSELDEWNDDKRFDASFVDSLQSLFSGLMDQVATTQDAVMLFFLFLGRFDGDERAGRKYSDIITELSRSEEYNGRRLSYQIFKGDPFTIKLEDGELIIKCNDDVSYGQATYSCYIEYAYGTLCIVLPINYDKSVFVSRVIPYLPIFAESLKILKGTNMKLKGIDFFYGDQPARDPGLAFCSNKTDDYLLPDFDTLSFFKNPPDNKLLNWGDRISSAYFRGTDTGASHFKKIENSQRILLCSLGLSNPDFVDAKITNCENKNNIEFYKKKGLWGEREPLANIGLYKYNVDVDGNTNSWAGSVNKLYGGFGGVTVKVKSPEGYRQWFYNRLQPWVNYVPINVDLSDLIDKIIFLQKNDGIAFGIHKNAANIFSGVDYDYLKNLSAHIIVSALLRLR
ncbi:hypothetical protein HER14_00160 [Acidithiobacillus thiooxidans]|uniref:glycosyl transferase family 90 n=1 Tax=Acidithiobacillus TaxID=119977 RepID=UPI001879ACC8|nr:MULTISPECIES: glycosyl transferase family 90 [Acidithiobacillus]MBE7565874.1 hypothetical protein [Acidithiobacillus sp. HP-11]MBU2749425.1 hypothetical protein [Acidithiobacillus thiooxidans]